MEQNCVVLIPAYNPPESMISYLEELQTHGFSQLILVDDGSREEKKPIFEQAADMGCIVLEHEGNQGKGSAVKNGLKYYQEHFSGSCTGVVIVSANGRFPVDSVEIIAGALREEQEKERSSLVLGTRDFSDEGLTVRNRNGNRIGRLIYRLLMSIELKDVQTGLRGIPDSLVEDCIRFPGSRYEYDASMLIGMEHAGYREVAIRTVPAPEDAERQFRTVPDTFRMAVAIFRRFLMFASVSISVSVFDIFLFWMFTEHFLSDAPYKIIWSTIFARIISATVNYIVNRRVVFQSNEDRRRSALQFLLLSAVQCSLSALLVHVLEWITGGNAVGLKVIVDTMLFFVNYKVQQHFIFVDDKKTEEHS